MKKWRKAMGDLTQSDAAKLFKMTREQVGRIERSSGLRPVYRFAMQYLYECEKNGVKPKLWRE